MVAVQTSPTPVSAPAAGLTTELSTANLRQFTVSRSGRDLNVFLPHDLHFVAQQALDASAPVVRTDEEIAILTELDLYAEFLEAVNATCRRAASSGLPVPSATEPSAANVADAPAVLTPAAKTLVALPLLRTLVIDVHRRFVGENSVHVAAAAAASPDAVIRAYIAAIDTLSRYLPSGDARDGVLALATTPKPALFSDARVRAMAVFGGQGSDYLPELRSIVDLYAPLVSDFLAAADAHLAALVRASPSQVRSLYPSGIAVGDWLAGRMATPEDDYLRAAPVSMPLIGLTQLAWYLAVVKAAGSSIQEARDSWFKASTGHSQGLITAVVLSIADSDASFVETSLQALTLLFHLGTSAAIAFPSTSVPPRIIHDAQENGEGTPSPMLGVNGALPLKQLRDHVFETNKHLPDDKRVHVALLNGPNNFIVAGPPQSLYGLCLRLRKARTPAGKDESRVPHGKRGLKFSARFLPMSAPFHVVYQAPAVERIRKVLAEAHELPATAAAKVLAVNLDARKMRLPVYSTDNGEDISSACPENLALYLADKICIAPVDWDKTIATHLPLPTHFIDFGPGNVSGGLTLRDKEGAGVQVITATRFARKGDVQGRSALFDARQESVVFGADWAAQYHPRLVRIGDTVHLDTKFTRLIGKPPVMVAGMTPTTVSSEFVSAVLNAGYHIELAGGGHFTEQMLRDKVVDIMKRVEPGNAITINMMFLNPRQWAFQYPLVQALRREGYPVEGVCVAAGVPSPDVADEILASLHACGIKHVAFKPGSSDAIAQVIRIAERHPAVAVMLQWTGGRAGGHHSFEDMHSPVLEHYPAMRRVPNLVLVAGSGFGGVEDTLPYLTGDWSLKFSRPAMPFDAVLFGSRMMVAKEARTSDAVKDIIVACAGVENEADWEQTYVKPTGGIITVRSELGEPIHKVATRGMVLWKELDDTIFALPKDKRAIAVREKKVYLIDRINRDAHRVWFGKKRDGSVAMSLADMSYGEVVSRVLELTYLPKLARWIDPSYGSLLMDILLRIEERFTPVSTSTNGTATKVPSVIDPVGLKSDPATAVAAFLARFPAAELQLLTTEDEFFLLSEFSSPIRKPVPFIPILDEALESWYKKDSLWQSEFVEALVDEDAQRACILQGPVATRHANKANVPAKEILDTVRDGHIAAVLERYYAGSQDAVPRREFLAQYVPATGLSLDNILVSVSGPKRVYELAAAADKLPELGNWVGVLAAHAPAWLKALLSSKHIVQGRMLAENFVPRLLTPRANAMVTITADSLLLQYPNSTVAGLKIQRDAKDSNKITVTLAHEYDEQHASLNLYLTYSPSTPFALIREDLTGRNDRVKAFYASLWDVKVLQGEIRSFKSKHTVDRASIARFCKVVGNDAEPFVEKGQERLAAPLDYAIVAGWQAVVQPLFSGLVDGDLLKLVHLSNNFKVLSPGSLVYAGDAIETTAEVVSMTNSPTGKRIAVRGTLTRASDGVALVEVTSAFFVRGSFDDFHRTFDNVAEEPIQLTLRRAQDLAVLESKDYIKFSAESPIPVAVGSTLVFRLQSHIEYQSNTTFASLHTTGTIEQVHMEQVHTVGHVAFECDHPLPAQSSPVVAMLQRLGGVTVEQPCLFDGAGYLVEKGSFVAPSSNKAYAAVSGDFNPIHTNPIIADLAGLPDTITHGMYTSAVTRRFVELYAAENQPSRVHSFSVDFVDMCVPNTELETTLRHIGMQNGRKIIEVLTSAKADGRVIVKGTAQVAQASSCFVFTGQGSQEVGMGMELYASSPVAREIWDRADAHFRTEFGFSILEIVRTNPKSKTVHFGGKRGRKIRDNYMTMTFDQVDGATGKVTTKSLFPSITAETESYTFQAPQGLLYATQFTQPALTLVEKAAFADMEAHGLIPPDCPFAGHSLGEYAALASVADVLPVESLVDIVFYRGMTMQHAVVRAADGSSNYGMCAVNPARVHKFFKEDDLEQIVGHVRTVTGSLLEIVNYNVAGWQYVVAGDLQGLIGLTLVLNSVAKGVFDQAKLEELLRNADLATMKLERGHATIPLAGIDVPFHSSFLLTGVTPFREYLQRKVKETHIHAQRLEGRYIPNLTAKPFRVTREYIAAVAKQTNSPVLNKVLKKLRLDTPEQKQQVAHTLLIELLAYQFASAVRWIETQDVLLAEYKVERIIEVGPSATLVGMAERTLKLKYIAYDDALTFRRSVLSYARNHQEIYYEFQDEAEAPAAAAAPAETGSYVAAAAPAPAAVPSNVGGGGGAAEDVPDAPISSTLLLGAIIAQKLKKSFAELPLSKSIKDLVGGKSTMQNEILGDLQKELGAIPERAEEASLEELAAQITVPGLGKHTSAVIAKLVAAKMPGGFTMSQVKDHLKATYGLGPLRADALLLLGATMEPANRLASEDEAKKWLATVSDAYAKQAGIQYRSSGGAGGSGSSGGAMPAMSAAQLKALFASQQQLWTSQLSALATALDVDLHASSAIVSQQSDAIEALQGQLDLWIAEHGDIYASGIQPMFDPRKARHFDSAWNWVRQHVLSLFFDIIFGRLREVDRDIIAQCLHVMNRADPQVIEYMEFWLKNHLPFFVDVKSENYALVRRLGKELVANCKEVLAANPVYKYVDVPTGPSTVMTAEGKLEYAEVQRAGIRKMASYVSKMEKEAHLHIKERADCDWTESTDKTSVLFKVMAQVADEGLSLAGKTMLITGCGRDSIGAAVLKGALSAGAKVIVTTSSFSQATTQHYRSIFEQHGSRGSGLVIVPFNAGSHTDTQRLIKYIYEELQWDLDFIVPFAAISENGRELTDIDSKSELAHRLMLTNLLRMLGLVAAEKRARDVTTRPAHVLLPLSPNHGTFGGDGLYGESKIALETLLNRWSSESWGEYLCVIGTVIGWTRGTGLMSSNNMVSQGIEDLGVYTFSTIEMAFNLLSLMHPRITKLSQEESLYVDLAGRMNRLPQLKERVAELRAKLMGTSELRQAVLRDQSVDKRAVVPETKPITVTPRANLTFNYPELPQYDALHKELGHLQGMVDLDRVVVITGFGEVGPYGNSRTRWEMEASGQLSLEGAIEMAWMMGLIRFHRGSLNGRPFSGWVDAESGAPVHDTEVKAKYEERILQHTGIRFIEPALFEGYNPEKKTLLQEVVLSEDLKPFEASKEEAERFLLEHGADKCIIEALPSGEHLVTLKKSATLYIPKALRFDRLVAGQIPTGWSAKRYGIPEDIVNQVDPITLYVLVSTVEALVNSGITDPYEFYKYVHVTEVGNTSGSGVGGMMANRKIFRERFLDQPVQNDILQESFINTMAAWVNLLLLSSSGPIKTPVGACATAVESVEIGVETIQSGKAKIVIVGGFDDFQEEGSYEFANMKATSSADAEAAMGRSPREMCRPATSTRGGFMESQGSGIQILMSATVAVEMGVPIYGVVAISNTATDKQGRSVPAPGQGILTTARQLSSTYTPRAMDIQYRKKQIERHLRQISDWMEDEVQELIEEAQGVPAEERDAFLAERRGALERDARRQSKAVLSTWGNDFWTRDPTIAPLRGALAVWGLNVDDIGVTSFHGTGTKANDFNESEVIHRQFEHLGRSKGNPVPAIFQKYLTGHPKGAAAAWMLNGVLQVLATGVVPGNRNADNIDPKLRQFTHILYPSVSMRTDGVKAALLKSFGFGQVGGELLVLHPHFVLATLSEAQYGEYSGKRDKRHAKAYRYWHDTLTGACDFVQVKHAAPYTATQESRVYLDPTARAAWDPKSQQYNFDTLDKPVVVSAAAQEQQQWLQEALTSSTAQSTATQQQSRGVGVDIELVSVFADLDAKRTFIERNFTAAETAYCLARPDPAASFAGRWAAKEAVVKALSSVDATKALTKGAGAPLIEIEVLPNSASGVPEVTLHGAAKEAGALVGVASVKVTISHSGEYAAAVCNAF